MEQTQLPQVQVKQGLAHSKTGEEKFELALSGEKVLSVPVENLKQVLRLAMLKLGIRAKNLPDEEEKQILIQHVIEYYGNHTCEEIKLAFDLAISGKLDIDVKAYENFSCLYFSQIMNAYRQWSLSRLRTIQEKQRRLLLPYEQRNDITDQEMTEWVEEWSGKYLKNESSVEYVPTIFYDFLSEKGDIKLTTEEKKTYFKKAIDLHEEHLLNNANTIKFNGYFIKDYQNFFREKVNNSFSDANRNTLQNLSKKFAVFNFLKNKENENRI